MSVSPHCPETMPDVDHKPFQSFLSGPYVRGQCISWALRDPCLPNLIFNGSSCLTTHSSVHTSMFTVSWENHPGSYNTSTQTCTYTNCKCAIQKENEENKLAHLKQCHHKLYSTAVNIITKCLHGLALIQNRSFWNSISHPFQNQSQCHFTGLRKWQRARQLLILALPRCLISVL